MQHKGIMQSPQYFLPDCFSSTSANGVLWVPGLNVPPVVVAAPPPAPPESFPDFAFTLGAVSFLREKPDFSRKKKLYYNNYCLFPMVVEPPPPPPFLPAFSSSASAFSSFWTNKQKQQHELPNPIQGHPIILRLPPLPAALSRPPPSSSTASR